MDKIDRVKMAEETLQISKQGFYISANGYRVNLEDLPYIYWPEQELIELHARWEQTPPVQPNPDFRIEFMIEDVIDTIFRLRFEGENMDAVGVLNFASAYSPGGGFIAGAKAQEETLAYCSDLYIKQVGSPYYVENHLNLSKLYCNNMIFSRVNFFRDSEFTLMDTPIVTNIITAPAVNMKKLADRGFDLSEANKVMKERMGYILDLMLETGCSTAVLGAFGCGVFGNDPVIIAQNWAELLAKRPYFNRIIMSVKGSLTDKNVRVFQQFFE